MNNLDIFYSDFWEDCNYRFEMTEFKVPNIANRKIKTTTIYHITVKFDDETFYENYIPSLSESWLINYAKLLFEKREMQSSQKLFIKKITKFVQDYVKQKST
jgi:hypothetical protein